MRVWLLRDGELLPTDGPNSRLLRMGMLAAELTKRGHQVVWWTSSFNHFKKTFRTNCDQDCEIDSNYLIKILHGPGYKSNISFRRIFHYRVIAKKFLQAAPKEEKPDIILAAMPTIEFSLAATQYGKQHNIPVIIDLRDMWPDIMVEVVPRFLQPLARIALGWQFKAMTNACKNATGLIGITIPFLQWGLNYAKRNQNQFDAVYPLGYLETGLDNNSIREAELFWYNKGIKRKHDAFIISFVGSINRSFQLELLIDTVKKKSDKIKLIIVGAGSELEKYKQLASNCNNIILTGWLSKPEIYVLLRLSSVGVAPYIERKDFIMSLTNKLAEYFSASLPIITSLPKTSVIGKYLLQYECGFCYDAADSTSLSKVIDQLQDNLELLEQMSLNARNVFEQEFNAEKIYSKLTEHLEKTYIHTLGHDNFLAS